MKSRKCLWCMFAPGRQRVPRPLQCGSHAGGLAFLNWPACFHQGRSSESSQVSLNITCVGHKLSHSLRGWVFVTNCLCLSAALAASISSRRHPTACPSELASLIWLVGKPTAHSRTLMAEERNSDRVLGDIWQCLETCVVVITWQVPLASDGWMPRDAVHHPACTGHPHCLQCGARPLLCARGLAPRSWAEGSGLPEVERGLVLPSPCGSYVCWGFAACPCRGVSGGSPEGASYVLLSSPWVPYLSAGLFSSTSMKMKCFAPLGSKLS